MLYTAFGQTQTLWWRPWQHPMKTEISSSLPSWKFLTGTSKQTILQKVSNICQVSEAFWPEWQNKKRDFSTKCSANVNSNFIANIFVRTGLELCCKKGASLNFLFALLTAPFELDFHKTPTNLKCRVFPLNYQILNGNELCEEQTSNFKLQPLPLDVTSESSTMRDNKAKHV